MFWRLSPIDDNDNLFSYIIAKHPDSSFERNAGPGRNVVASFEDNKKIFSGHVKNDSLTFLETARKLNMSNYIHTQLSAVCPHNLRGFDVTFRSVIRGKNAGGITDDEFSEPKMLGCIIGPYPVPIQQIEAWFEDAGILCEKDPGSGDIASVIKLQTKEPMTVTEFLQKIYLISYYITRKHVMVSTQDKQLEKFVNFCKGWINEMELRNRLINGLCKYNKQHIEQFESVLLDKCDMTEEEKEERWNSVEGFVNRVGLHQRRHNLIIDEIPEDATSFIELGCGGGRLLTRVVRKRKELDMLGIELSGFLTMKVKKRKELRNVRVSNSSILFPHMRESDLLPDFIACTEVIEHLVKTDRQLLIELFKTFYIPKKFVITVPNFEFNKHFDNLEELTGYRHPDHKIEHTHKELVTEIIEPLSDMYDMKIVNIITERDPDMSPTWVVVGEHKEPESRKLNTKMFEKVSSMYHPVYLPMSDYNVNSRQLSSGYSNKAFLKNGSNIFYLAHTMSPVEYSQKAPNYLEHPFAAFDYYKDRSINTIYEEDKYMGSRGYSLAFRDPEHAKKLGYDRHMISNSRL